MSSYVSSGQLLCLPHQHSFLLPGAALSYSLESHLSSALGSCVWGIESTFRFQKVSIWPRLGQEVSGTDSRMGRWPNPGTTESASELSQNLLLLGWVWMTCEACYHRGCQPVATGGRPGHLMERAQGISIWDTKSESQWCGLTICIHLALRVCPWTSKLCEPIYSHFELDLVLQPWWVLTKTLY